MRTQMPEKQRKQFSMALGPGNDEFKHIPNPSDHWGVAGEEGLDSDVRCEDSDESATSASKQHRKSRRASQKVKSLSDEASARAKRRWRLLKGLVNLLCIWLSFIKKTRSMGLVKSFLSHVGEWTRIMAAGKRLLRSVKSLQRHYRAWVRVKKHRCEAINKIWQRVEDEHLVQYFKVFARKIAQEIKHTEEKGLGQARVTAKKGTASLHSAKTRTLSNYSDPEGFVEEQLNWKMYRIPAEERKRVIDRYYLKQLKRHVWAHQEFQGVIQSTLRSQSEIHSFLRQLGIDDAQSAGSGKNTLASGFKSHAFWQISEAKVLELIAVTAQGLIQVEPFHQHPANKDLPKNTKAKSRASRTARAQAEFSGKNVSLGRLSQVSKPLSEDASKAPSRQKKAKASDIDDILRQCTPRLKEIAENTATVGGD